MVTINQVVPVVLFYSSMRCFTLILKMCLSNGYLQILRVPQNCWLRKGGRIVPLMNWHPIQGVTIQVLPSKGIPDCRLQMQSCTLYVLVKEIMNLELSDTFMLLTSLSTEGKNDSYCGVNIT